MPDSSVRPTQRPPSMRTCPSSDASIRSSVPPIPPMTPQVTKTPTASSAVSFTTDSTAIAMTTPWCRSFASRFRVPKITVKSASPMAT